MIFEYAFVLCAYLFSISIYGLITSRNMVRTLICQLKGNIFSIFVIIVATVVAIESTIFSLIYRNRKSTCINKLNC
ncbi:NAD(P)H-quinone oxidoreductase subunit 4L, chloroplastic, partial [Mucuna pruriens]